jgi:hypothetical protein
MKNPSATKKGSGRRHVQGYSRAGALAEGQRIRLKQQIEALKASGLYEQAAMLQAVLR